MKNIFTFLVSIILILSIVSCSPLLDNDKHKSQHTEVKETENDKNRSVIFHEFNTNIIFNLEDLIPYISTPDLLLVPQGEDDYPKLNGVEAKVYELIDGGVYVHVFSNNEELKKGASQVKDDYDIYGNWGAIVYEVNNMLFVYFPSTEELKKENDIKMRNAIENMIKNS